MILVVDASAAVKLLLTERGSELVRSLWDEPLLPWVAPAIVVPEVAAALAGACRASRIEEEHHRGAARRWRELTGEVDLRNVDASLAVLAGQLTTESERPLRGMDALYLATALELLPDAEVALLSFDMHQRDAVAPDGGVGLIPWELEVAVSG